MSASLNKVMVIGNLGKDPEVRRLSSGDPVVNFSVAASETWKDKSTGEKKEKTEWVRVVVFGPLAKIAEQYLRKGSRVYVEGKLQTRKWQDQSGNDRYSTEVSLQGFDAKLIMLNKVDSSASASSDSDAGQEFGRPQQQAAAYDDMDDSIPF